MERQDAAGEPERADHLTDRETRHVSPHWQQATVVNPGLEERGNVFFAAIQMTRMPMILTDPNLPDNPIVFANQAFQELTGYPAEEIVGRNCRFLQGAQTDRHGVAEMRQSVEMRQAISTEILNYRRDGSPFWNAVFIAPVYATDGKLLYFFASQLDITRRRLSEEAFRQAQKMESIGQLTAGLAHDFNNLLQVILGNLEVLESRVGGADVQRPLERARDAAERGSKLTRQLLAFARKTRLDPKVVDLNELIQDFGPLLESTVGEHCELELQLRRRLPPIMVDASHLEMALLNVVINARDASPARSLIRVGTAFLPAEGEAEGGYVSLSVRDEGEGMAPYVRSRATEPFFTTKPTGKGTGLGLAMVHGFVQQSRGRLEIDSELGVGTTIRMLFPVATESERASPAPVAATPLPERRESQEAESILVVEDNDDVLTLARDHLTSLGYVVHAAHGAEEALAILESLDGEVDLLFSDILMPGSMNGLVLAEQVRERWPRTAILLATGYNDDLVMDGPAAPEMDVVSKPYRRAELADRVRAALNRAPGEYRKPPRRFLNGPQHEA